MLVLAIGPGARAAVLKPNQEAPIVAIVGADVLPMTGPEKLTDQTVIVQGDRVKRVGPRGRVGIPRGARIIDGTGKTLMPGLVDMHVHLAPVPGEPGDAAQRAMAVMLAHGVTTARTMAGSPANLEVRAAVESGRLAGPRLYAAAPGLHLQNTPTADAARAAVRAAREAGFDLIKSHHLTALEIWEAVQDEARRQGLATAGHVTNEVGLDRAMAAGQQVEHLDGVIFQLLPEGAPERAIPFAQIPPPPVIAAASRATDAQIETMAKRVRESGGFHVPTLALFELVADVGANAGELRGKDEMRYVPDAVLEQWAAQREQLVQSGFTAADGAALKALRRRIVRAFHAAGVPLMTGSDTAQSFHIWGPGLHDEIRALNAAGLSPIDALRSATLVPRNYLRSLAGAGSSQSWPADFGTVEAGARADLILLSDDPRADLAVLDRPELVIAGGRVFDRPALDAMLAKASRDAKMPPQAAAATVPLTSPVFVMRHLEAGAGDDPELTPTGAMHARRLATELASAGLKAIFATPYRRARETAAPLAETLGLPVQVYDPADPEALVRQLQDAGGPALVIGHSNTVPDLVARFGGKPPEPIGQDRFGDIWHISGSPRSAEHRRLEGVH